MYNKLVVVGHFSEHMSRDKSEGEITGTDKKFVHHLITIISLSKPNNAK